MHNFRFSIIATITCFLVVAQISAEVEKIDDVVEVKDIINQSAYQELQRKVMFARKLVADRNYEGASSYLEVLYEKDATNQVIINLLRQCYSQLKQYFKLEELIKKLIESDKTNIGYWLSLAEVTAVQGKTTEALKHYKTAVSLVTGLNRVRYQLIIQSMLTHNLDSEAKQFILDWRKDSGDNSLLGDKMGVIYEGKKEYRKAMGEYYPMLYDTTRIGSKVEKEIVELLLFEDSSPIAEKYLLEQNKKKLNIRAVKILSMHYIRTKQLDKSFAFTKLRDSLAERNGNSLISYMQTCKREKLYDESIRMGEYLLGQYKNPAIQNRARFLIADAYTHNKQFKNAINTYDSIYVTTKSVRDKADALYNIAKVYQDNLFDIDTALLYFDSLTTYHKSGLSYMNAQVDIPYCYLQKGELDKSKELYLLLENKRLHVDIKEKILFQIAQILFIENNIDSCKTTLSKILINFPTGFYVNDALSLMKIIQTGSDAPPVLEDYALSLFYEIQRNNDSVVIMLDKVAQNSTTILADFALFRLSEILIAQNNFSKAITYIDQMEQSFSESYYFPFSLKQKADILISEYKKTDEAYKIYRHLLIDFPNYPFITEVRDILRSASEDKSDQTS